MNKIFSTRIYSSKQQQQGNIKTNYQSVNEDDHFSLDDLPKYGIETSNEYDEDLEDVSFFSIFRFKWCKAKEFCKIEKI